MHHLKKLFIIFPVVVLIISCKSKSLETNRPENGWKRFKLHGKVKSFSQVSYEAIEQSGQVIKGKRKQFVSYDKDKKITFNHRGYMLEKNTFNSKADLIKSVKYKYTFNKNNYLDTLMILSSRGNLQTFYTYKYDSHGNHIESDIYNWEAKLKGKTLYKYDNNDNLIEKRDIYNDPDKWLAKWTYKNNWRGKMIEKKAFKNNWRGKMIEKKAFNHKGQLQVTYIYKYNWKGDKVGVSWFYPKGKVRVEWRYDNFGNSIAYRSYDPDGRLEVKETYRYIFDKHHNWIKRIAFKNGKPLFIQERSYVYYD